MTSASRLTQRLRAISAAAARAGALPAPVAFGFAAGFAIILATSSFAFSRFRQMHEAAAWVNHTQEVIQSLHAVREGITEAEADVRGHALARDAVPVRGVWLSVTTARRQLALARRWTTDNAEQQRRLDSLRTLLDWRVALLDSSLALDRVAEEVRAAAMPRIVARGQGLSAAIRNLIARSVRHERGLLDARRAAEERAVRHANDLIGLGLAAAAVVAAVCVILTRRAARRQAIAEQERDAGAVQLQAQSEELEVQNEELLAQTDELARQTSRLRSARDYLRSVFEHLADGLITFDDEGRPAVSNSAARRILGVPYSHSDARAAEWCRGWLEADGRTPIADGDAPLARLMRGENVEAREVVVAPRTTGERRTVVVTGRHVRDAQGVTLGSILALHDITARKEIERIKNELVSVVSHELRTPLTSIRGSLGLLDAGAAGALPPRAAPLVSVARRNADRLISLVNDLLDLEKLAAAGLSRRDDVVRVTDATTAALETVRGFAEQHRVALHATTDADVSEAVVRGDRDRLAQVVTNLLSNAVKFSPAGADVALRVVRLDRGVRVSVRDRGPGIAEHDLVRLFGKFQQLDGSDSRRHGGTGLGLAICKGIVEEHGGRIGVDTRVGEGAEFWFELPLAV